MSLSRPRQNEDNSSEDEGEVKSVWDIFTKSASGHDAKCSLCSSVLKISKGSYKGLKVHLSKKHNLSIGTGNTSATENQQLKRPSSVIDPVPSTSKDTGNEETNETTLKDEVPKKRRKQTTIDGFFKQKYNMETMVSRMVCKDGYPLSTFCTSSDLRYLFSKNGMQLPTSPNTIRSIVTSFADTVKADMIKELNDLKKQGHKFALTFDEWTKNNQRYLNLNVHHEERYYNLGLIRIHGSCTAEYTVHLIKDRLTNFDLDLESDIVGMTTDGASVMIKVGKIVPCFQQLCYAHGIQLAIVDVLYKKRQQEEVEEQIGLSSAESDDDDGEDPDEGGEMTVIREHTNLSSAELNPKYNYILLKVRKVVKLFKKSPTKNDIFLQKYIKEETGKELSLILDCRTRWSSLLSMLERFFLLKNCIDKALIDIKSEIKFTDLEWIVIKDLIDCLQPLKLAVEAVCRREATLLTAETSLKFALEKLCNQETTLSAELVEKLRERINERRNSLITGILVYLNNPKKYDINARQTEIAFPMPKKNAMRQEMKKILTQVIKDHMEIVEPAGSTDAAEETSDSDSPTVQANLTLKEELEKQILKEKESYNLSLTLPKRKIDYEKVLKKEMSTYEVEGVKGKYLTLMHNYLVTVKPTSVEAERAFSAAGYICSKLRSRLGDETINTICFLRSFFQNQDF